MNTSHTKKLTNLQPPPFRNGCFGSQETIDTLTKPRIGCRLEDGTVNINAEVKRLMLGCRGMAIGFWYFVWHVQPC